VGPVRVSVASILDQKDMTVRAAEIASDVKLRVRDYSFGREGAPERWWLNGDPVASAIFDGLSATFPHGERFFMDALRPYRDEAPDGLRAQIGAFIKQEAMHTREHVAFNRHVAAHGRNLQAMDARSKAVVDKARAGTPEAQLAATAALEHCTAILSHVLLANPGYLEEIEHKAVAFDALAHVVRERPAWRRWLLRTRSMREMSALFSGPTLGNILQILREDDLSELRIRWGVLRYMLIYPGLLWKVIPLYLTYYLPRFHPWQLDDRDLLAKTEHELG
jgi:predicted metal-dependent hydrolase